MQSLTAPVPDTEPKDGAADGPHVTAILMPVRMLGEVIELPQSLTAVAKRLGASELKAVDARERRGDWRIYLDASRQAEGGSAPHNPAATTLAIYLGAAPVGGFYGPALVVGRGPQELPYDVPQHVLHAVQELGMIPWR